MDIGQVAAVFGFQLDVFAHQAAQQHLGLADHLAGVQRDALDRLLAGEGQQVAHQVLGAGDDLADAVQVLVGRIAQRVVEQQLVVTELEPGQQVVEVVRHAAGDLADGLHLLRLDQVLLETLLLGDVEQIDAEAVAHRADIDLHGTVRHLPRGIDRRQGNVERSRLVDSRLGRRAFAQLVAGRQLLDQVGLGRSGDEIAEGAAGQGIGFLLQQGGKDRIEFGDVGRENVFAHQQGAAEGRRAGKGVEHGIGRFGRPRFGNRHRRVLEVIAAVQAVLRNFMIEQQAVAQHALRGGAHQDQVVAQARSHHFEVEPAQAHQGAAGALRLGFAQRGEQRRRFITGRQAPRRATGVGPRGIGGQQVAVEAGDRRRFGQGADDLGGLEPLGFQHFLLRGKSEHAKENDAREGDQDDRQHDADRQPSRYQIDTDARHRHHRGDDKQAHRIDRGPKPRRGDRRRRLAVSGAGRGGGIGIGGVGNGQGGHLSGTRLINWRHGFRTLAAQGEKRITR